MARRGGLVALASLLAAVGPAQGHPAQGTPAQGSPTQANPAQQRSPFFATVVGPDGGPIAGASVTCVFTPDVVNPWDPDIVIAPTNARGQARCNLAVGRLYFAWAV